MNDSNTCPLHTTMEKENIRLETKICEVETTARTARGTMYNDIKGKVPYKVFMWIAGIMIAILIGISGTHAKFAHDTSVSVTELKTMQKVIIEKLK